MGRDPRDYDFASVESEWQRYWEENGTFQASDSSDKPKFYCLVEFPYPSGDGLHVGHPRSYTALDILARKRRMDGYNVLYPMGFDSFGLPTENYAIKTGEKPAVVTKRNIARFKEQLKSLGFSFDWSREISTTEPEYYKWTQWIFLKLHEKGLAYKAKMPINWCVSCKIGLANEEVVDGVCERCGGEVEKRAIEQWMLKITAYADRLIDDLETVDFPDRVKTQQINWIGRSEGAEVVFGIDGFDGELTVFTTRPDTLFGATYMVLAPEHPLVPEITVPEKSLEVAEYVKSAAAKSDIERSDAEKDKTGVFTGSYAVNPVNGAKIPIWVADYVMIGYGTGAIMAVPAHDTRDFEFAKTFGLPILCINEPEAESAESAGVSLEDVLAGNVCWPGEGKLVNSANSSELDINGLSVADAKRKTIAWLESKGLGKAAVNFKLRDWVFSRQRYWGEPIPMVNCPECGWTPLPESELPLLLPEVEKYEPTDTGESPLAAITEWVETTCPKCGAAARRETDTMPNWAGSSWYFLRYIDPRNDQAFADPAKLENWMPVDWYNGGMEHTTLHLLYSRFWNKFLYDCGLVPTSEPYNKRSSHGMVLGEGGEKMSKSRGNVINPDDVTRRHGADVFRLYEMFIGPFEQAAAWDTKGISGVDRFIHKVWRLYTETGVSENAELSRSLERVLHATVKKVSEDIETLDLNTAISQMMVFMNEFSKAEAFPRSAAEPFLKVLAPFAPHICEELWRRMGNESPISLASWPEYDEKLAKDDEVEILLQIKGRPVARITMSADASREDMERAALGNADVAAAIGSSEPRKVVCVPGRLVNIVV
jgi:leucyl-tRNA synthetase